MAGRHCKIPTVPLYKPCEIEKKDLKNVTLILEKNSVHYDELGKVNDKELIIDDKSKVSIDDLIKSHTIWLTNYMNK